MSEFARPRVVVSQCLGFDACRYNGETIPNRFLRRLEPHVELVMVCPEVEIGLGVPRDPIRIVREKEDGERLVQPSTGLDLTERMNDFAAKRTADLPEVDGFVLKSRSPSCGVTDAKVHSPKESAPVLGRGPGLFAAAVLERFPGSAVEDEGRLTNFRIREHFLTRIFVSAAFRDLRKRPSMGRLVEFQADHKLLFMALNQTRMRELGRIVANPERRPVREVCEAYGEQLSAVFARQARFTSHVNVLMHALGYFKDRLSSGEKAHFLDLLEQYRGGKVPLSALNSVVRSWIVRFGEDYLDRQRYFDPFPEDLVEITDSGKGRGR